MYQYQYARTYKILLQLMRIQNGNLDEEYVYQAGQNNGRIVKSIDHLRNETVDYTYDALNRLVSAEEESGKWGNAFSYDGWGNMNGQTFTPGYAATPGTVTPPGPHSGDANGNTGPQGAVFDVENRLVSAGTGATNYGYDPWGKRVTVCCTTDQYNNPTRQIVFYDLSGRRVARYQLNGTSLMNDTVYTRFGGSLFQMTKNGQVTSVSIDRLGSIRANSNGETFAYYPFGQERTFTADGRDKFGTYFRDAPGQDYADQRYYNANSGSFWSPDPGGIKTASPKDPVSWNRYAYTGDDPVNRIDPAGTCWYTIGGDPVYTPCSLAPGGGDRDGLLAPEAPPGDAQGPAEGGGGVPIGPLLSVSRLTDFEAAFEMAKAALADEDCSGLFGLDANSMDPGQLLDTLRNGLSDFGYPNSGSGYMNATNGLAQNVNAITSEVGNTFFANNTYSDKNANGDRVVSDSVAISISIQLWNANDIAYNAAVLIHELGHVFNELKGAGGSMFAQDVDPVTGRTDWAAEAYNQTLEQKCIH
jgi:RHS repeat-associated protein